MRDVAINPSFNLTLPWAWPLMKGAGWLLKQDDVDRVVVTHGTDTMQETRFLADIPLESKKPLVFTAAQLPDNHPQSDGPRNILDSMRAAAAVAATSRTRAFCSRVISRGRRQGRC